MRGPRRTFQLALSLRLAMIHPTVLCHACRGTDSIPVGKRESIGLEVSVGLFFSPLLFFFSLPQLLKFELRLWPQCFRLSEFHKKARNDHGQDALAGVLVDELPVRSSARTAAVVSNYRTPRDTRSTFCFRQVSSTSSDLGASRESRTAVAA